MKIGENFNRLVSAISENNSYKLNAAGMQLIQQFHGIIANFEKVLTPHLTQITKDPNKIAKQTAIQIISSINSTKEGTEIFDLMSRLDTMTNGGKTPISGATFTFNQNDKILQYLEITQ